MEKLLTFNVVSVAILCIVALTVVQGIMKGASGTARHLFLFVAETITTLVSVFLAWKAAERLSPVVADWLSARNISIPTEKIGTIEQMYYTFVTAVRDFPLLRLGLLLLLLYMPVKQMLGFLLRIITDVLQPASAYPASSSGRRSIWSSAAGGAIGLLLGAGRAALVLALLFVFVTLQPQGVISAYIQASSVYQQGATQVFQPFAGDFLAARVPVLAREVQEQFDLILQRKYEVIDQHIPDDIAGAAAEVTAGLQTDEEKARALYNWVGTRVRYDWDKVRLYEKENKWLEQSPEDTFESRRGVCIDYARLYAVMARSVGLKSNVITGLGYDGRGSYGPHAWNEVYASEQSRWIPLDSTWLSSGGDWFDSSDFYQTHVRDA